MRISLKITAALITCISGLLAYGSAQAGPCTADIAQFETLMRQTGHNPDAGLMAHQSIDAQLSAKLLDAQGNPGCAIALKAAEKLYIP
jgi:hypothetical protein